MDLYNCNSLDIFTQLIKKYKDEHIIIVTDPPFNIGYKYNEYLDNMDETEYYEMIEFFVNDLPSVIIHYPEQLYKISFQIGKFPEKVISWVYNSNTAKQHRDIAFFGIKPNMGQVRQPYKNPNDKRIQERIAKGCVGAKLYDWWDINQVKNVSKEKTTHPCQMPLQVMKNIVGILPYDCVIIDPFMGSGTTGEAIIEMNRIQNANRKFVGIEIDEKYFNIAKERIEKAQNKWEDLD